ncbi:glycosyltransferase family 2 protein [Pedobacter immunditicola]|uniref:glycosyltransferase family 2 protein n=1 Tax=Pedobacter immunditicola TaxID=3133440 RepID=UPI0030B65D63
MKVFLPYIIHHIELNKSLVNPKFETKGAGSYVVFWWNDIGLGQCFIDPDQHMSESDYDEHLIRAIKPFISFYSKHLLNSNEDWEGWIRLKKLDCWNEWMRKVLDKFTSITIPFTVPVSVVICTHNRAAQLQQCLLAIKKLECQPEEIIVVDNDPADDSTKVVVEGFQGLKYVREPKKGLDNARNTGIWNSTQAIIAFTDDDVIVHRLWVYRIWETFRDQKVGAMTGLVIPLTLDTEAQFIFEKHWSFNRGYIEKIYDENYFISALPTGPPVWEIGAGANMAFRKSILNKTGYFNEILDVGAAGCNGDSELWFRILAKGYSIYYNPMCIAFHEHRQELKALRKQLFYYMRGFTTAALVQQKQLPEADYKRHRLRQFPRYYLKLLVKGFPHNRLRLKTIFAEVCGIISGLRFYYKHHRDFL